MGIGNIPVPFCRAAQSILAASGAGWLDRDMIEIKPSDVSPVGRRIRLSTREIVLSVLLTVAALTAIVAVRYGSDDDEAMISKALPVALQGAE